jgi:very-short-patch-repair endonuclease
MHPDLKRRARELRRDMTVPEQRLWSMLRNRRLGGLKFRRQHPSKPFITDFCCEEANLIVELDGMTHVGRATSDKNRSAVLSSKGYRVIRFTNDEVLQFPEAVAATIARAAGLNW